MAKLSTGFAGSSTRSTDDVTKEVETRMAARKLGAFDEDFRRPGTTERSPGQDYSKPGQSEGYQKPHEDFPARAPGGFTLAAAGNARDQEELDWQDEFMQRQQGGIKKIEDQFPGRPSLSKMVEKRMAASDNAGYDVHQTDPKRMNSGVVHHEEYRGHHIHVMDAGPTCNLAIDSVVQPGKFPGVATAVQRGRILIDRNNA